MLRISEAKHVIEECSLVKTVEDASYIALYPQLLRGKYVPIA